MARTWKCGDSANFADLTKLREGPRGVAIHRNADSRVCGEIVELKPIEALGVGRAPFIAQTNIDSEPGGDLPIILHVEGSLF